MKTNILVFFIISVLILWLVAPVQHIDKPCDPNYPHFITLLQFSDRLGSTAVDESQSESVLGLFFPNTNEVVHELGGERFLMNYTKRIQS